MKRSILYWAWYRGSISRVRLAGGTWELFKCNREKLLAKIAGYICTVPFLPSQHRFNDHRYEHMRHRWSTTSIPWETFARMKPSPSTCATCGRHCHVSGCPTCVHAYNLEKPQQARCLQANRKFVNPLCAGINLRSSYLGRVSELILVKCPRGMGTRYRTDLAQSYRSFHRSNCRFERSCVTKRRDKTRR